MTSPIVDEPQKKPDGPLPGSTLLAAGAVVTVGALSVDPSRLPLLLIPCSFLLASWCAALLLERFAGPLAPSADMPMLSLALRLGTGAALLSLIAVACGLAGSLNVAGAVTALLAAAGLYPLARTIRGAGMSPATTVSAAGGPALGFVWLIAWLWVTIPPVFYDELVYHLVIPQRALATGSLPTLPGVYFSYMPYASDLLLAWGLFWGGDLGARAMHWTWWLCCSIAAWGLADALVPSKRAPWIAPLIACAVAGSPTLWFLGTLPFAETCLAAAVLFAACALAAPPSDRRPWLTVGLLLGLTGSVKLNGLVWIGAGLSATLILRWSKPDLVRVGLIILISMAPWWGRAFFLTGNPVYPLAYRWLGGHPWNDTAQAFLKNDLPPSGWDQGLAQIVKLPVEMVLHPERFGSAADVGALAVVATFSLVMSPVLSRVLGSAPHARRLCDAAAAFTIVSVAAWLATSTTTRFLAPVLLLGLTAAVSAGLSYGRAAFLASVLAVAPLGLAGTVRFLDEHDAVFASTAVALGQENPDRYLSRRVDHAEAARFVRTQLPPDAKLLLIGEARPYYFARAAIAPYPFEPHPLGDWVREAPSSEDLARRLASEGITHVVLNVREFTRLHDKYGVLAFTGDQADLYDRRLKQLPRFLRQIFAADYVYVFEVPPLR